MPHGSAPGRTEPTELTVFVLADSDPPNRLALRVMRHIAAIERSGQRIASATLVAGAERGAQALAARCLMARALFAHQVNVGAGELVFSTRVHPDGHSQHELLALVGALTGERGAQQISIRVLIDVDDAAPVASIGPDLASTRRSLPLDCCPAACHASYSVN
jgi:hypothetical protein